MLEKTLFDINKKRNENSKTRKEVFFVTQELLSIYKNSGALIKCKQNILLNRHYRYIRTGYFTIYPKKYHNTYIEYVFKKQQRYIKRMEDSLYVEYMENAYRKYYNQVRFEKDSYNSSEKERELFYEYEKLALIGVSLLFDNELSHYYLIPKIKDVKRMYRDFKVTVKYYVHMKRLEDTFHMPNRFYTNNTKIVQIIKKSFVYKIRRPKYNYITLTRDSIKGPPNLFKESCRLYKIKAYIQGKLNRGYHIKDKSKEYITKYMRKFYYDVKWNFIFINKIFRDISTLIKKSLRNMYNLEYRVNELLLDMHNVYRTTNTIKLELYYRLVIIILLTQRFNPMSLMEAYKHKKSKLKKSTHIVFLINKIKKIQHTLYLRIKLIAVRERIKEIIKNRIINYYMPYVTIMSKQYLRSGYHAEISELVQEGTVGVLEAAERYQLGRGVRFLTYAYWWMHRYMIKIAIKKKKMFRYNRQSSVQKKILLRIDELYNKIKKRLDEKYKPKIVQEQTKEIFSLHTKAKHIKLKNILPHRDFVIYMLYTGTLPYRVHTTDQIASILEVPEYMIQTRLRKVDKIVHNLI